MNVVRFNPRRREPRPPGRDVVTPLLAVVALVAMIALGLALFSGSAPQGGTTEAFTKANAGERRVHFSMCGRNRYTCVVDGDTIWLDGMNLRLKSYDTPEPYDDICGGQAEVALAKKASARLLQLLNSNAFTIDTFGLDNTGKRTLATVRIGGRDVGDILIEERLARRWPDGDEWWCS